MQLLRLNIKIKKVQISIIKGFSIDIIYHIHIIKYIIIYTLFTLSKRSIYDNVMLDYNIINGW